MSWRDKGKILFVAHYFAPKNEIASVRLTRLAENLAVGGWDVDVLTVDANLHNPLERRLDLEMKVGGVRAPRVVRRPVPKLVSTSYRLRGLLHPPVDVSPNQGRGGATPRRPTGKRPLGAMAFIRTLLRRRASRLSVAVRRRLDSAYVAAYAKAPGLREEYDIVYVSYGPSFMIPAGMCLAERFPEARFIVDVRDPIVRRGVLAHEAQQALQLRLESALAARADAITVTEPEMLVQRDAFRQPVVRVVSGFDPDLHATYGRSGGGSPLRIYYGGRLYASQRFDSLLDAILRLQRDGLRVQVDYAGADGSEFLRFFEAKGLGGIVRDHGSVTRTESLQLAAKADVFLILTWNTAERGIMPGKTFEAIALDVPILGIVAGEAESSALARMFRGDPFRKVFGSASTETDSEAIGEFLRFAMTADDASRELWFGPTHYRHLSHTGVANLVDRLFRQVLQTGPASFTSMIHGGEAES